MSKWVAHAQEVRETSPLYTLLRGWMTIKATIRRNNEGQRIYMLAI
jgi:hypothetical protein